MGRSLPVVRIIMATYNRVRTIGRAVNSVLCQTYKNIELIIVDDGSTDNTAQIAGSLPVRMIHHSQNMGKGAALRTALKTAHLWGYDWLLTLDGDGQHPPRYIPEFFNTIELNNSDLILGDRQSRFKNMPIHRMLSNGMTSVILSLCAGNSRIHDSQCGFRAVRLNCYQDYFYKENGFQFESEMILRFGKNNCSFAEIPIQTSYEQETSSIHLVYDTYKFIKLVINSFFW